MPALLTIQDPPGLPSYMYKERQIFKTQFVDNDKKLNLFKPGNPIHSWYTTACNPTREECDPLLSNFAFINISTDDSYADGEFEVGMPFHASHFDGVTVDGQNALVCETSYLAIGISRNCNRFSKHPDAFLVQAEDRVQAASCRHEVKLDDGRRLTRWKAVALLAGWRKGDSSLGTVVATSPGGSRVAAATWSRILIWSFHPKMLHQGELQHYFPTRDYNERKGFGRLRPTLLSPEGVVHNLLWTDETHLYATTDQGLVKWDIGPLSDGERDELTLTYDAWPDTAVAVAAMPHKLRNYP